MIEKILERLEAESKKWLDVWNDASKKAIIDNYADGMNDGFDEAISIVQEVAKEYGKDTNVCSNADHIRSMTDEELAELFAKFTTICEMCVHYDENCITMADARCKQGILHWLKSEAKE